MENTKEVCLSKMSVLHRGVNKNPEMFLTTQVACYPKQLSTTFVGLQILLCPLHVILPSFKLYFLFWGGGGGGNKAYFGRCANGKRIILIIKLNEIYV